MKRRFTDVLATIKQLNYGPLPPVPASQVPILFHEPYILSGYRPIGQDWRCYFLSIFQKHNESLNIWTHLLAGALLLMRWWAHIGALGYPLDSPSLPLCLFVASSLTYLSLSMVAHLFQSHSELTHYSMFFLDYAGVGVYQYGCALGHYFYSSEAEWRESAVGRYYFPVAALLAWLSCATCCFAKSHFQRPYPPRRKICTLIPMSLAYVVIISPVAHRLASTPWSQDPSLELHASHMLSFLLSAIFFSCPVPERFLPGRCDFVAQGHQIFHVLMSLSTLCQLEALVRDYNGRRETVAEIFGEERLRGACILHLVLVCCCLLTALLARRSKCRQLQKKEQ